MSVNQTAIFEGEVVLLPDERIMQKFEDVQMDLESGTGYPATSTNYYSRVNILISRQRVVLKSLKMEAFEVLEIPMEFLESFDHMSPLFSSSYLQLQFKPLIGLRAPASLKLYFKKEEEFLMYSVLKTIKDSGSKGS